MVGGVSGSDGSGTPVRVRRSRPSYVAFDRFRIEAAVLGATREVGC
jgi:hypothetical protein